MSLAQVFNQLGQTVMPAVGAAVFADTLTVKADAPSTDSGGGRIKGSATDAYTNVPCAYEPTTKSQRFQESAGDKAISTQEYLVTIPTHSSAGTRYNLNPTIHRLVVNARGNEPVKTFRIITIRDDAGVVFECVCQREG